MGVVLWGIAFVIIPQIITTYHVLTDEVRTYEVNVGYAGEPIQFDKDTIYIELYTDPGDIDIMDEFVSSEGTIVIQNSPTWTSSGYLPQKGDLVRVSVMRTWKFDKQVYGFSVTEFISHPKPFGLIGKTIEAKPSFYNETRLDKSTTDPIVVIDATKDFVRVKLQNGDLKTFGWGWFLVSKNDLPVSHRWIIGNKFQNGDKVCLIEENPEDLPLTAKVLQSKGDHIKVNGHEGWINFTYYKICQK
jgi:hypothetical protein